MTKTWKARNKSQSSPTPPALKPTRRARAPRGAKRRAVAALVSKKQAAAMTQADLFSFWSAASMKEPPPLRTTFGNFSTVNSVCRFNVLSNDTHPVFVWIPWSPSPVAALTIDTKTNGTITQYLFGTLVSGSGSSPGSIRPLRLSFSIENLTQLVNSQGQVRVYSLDNSLNLLAAVGATTTAGCRIDNSATSLGSLMSQSPDVEEVTVGNLTTEHEWVSVPASYPGYNKYYEFVELGGATSGVGMESGDLYNLSQGYSQTYPYSAASTFSIGRVPHDGALGNLPPMRGFILEIPKTTNAQDLRFVIHRQDGARYPVNSLGATFAKTPIPASTGAEDMFHSLARRISSIPAASVPRRTVSESNWGHATNLAMSGAKWASKQLAMPAAQFVTKHAGPMLGEMAYDLMTEGI